MELTREELIRYNRQIILPNFGVDGQKKLKTSKVLVIGAGGLGAPNLQYLSGAGIGTIGIVDFDVVSLTNLQRQVLFDTSQINENKAEMAISRLKKLNPEVTFNLYKEQITSENAMAIIEPYDLVIDGSDNLPTRYLVNDACVLLGKTLLYGAIFRYEGQVSVFNHEREDGTRGPNYRDIFPDPPPPEMVPSCSEGGVFGALAGIVGAMQANEAIKILAGLGSTLSGRLLLYDSLDFTTRYLNIRPSPSNPVSGDNPTITELIDYEAFCAGPTIDRQEDLVDSISVKKLEEQMKTGSVFILDVRESYEYEISNINGINIPLGELESRLDEIPKEKEVIVHCKSGVRSRKAIEVLKKNDYTQLLNLEGGILAWQEEIDSAIQVY